MEREPDQVSRAERTPGEHRDASAGPATATAIGNTTAWPAGPPLLEVADLHTQYPVRRGLVGTLSRRPRRVVRAVDGISFSLRKGEMVALVGESGCGKTTTAQTVLRLVEPTSGSIRLNGADITRLSQRELRPLRRSMQMIYQDPYESLDPRFRVRQAVEEPMLIHSVGNRADRRERIVAALNRAELSPPHLFMDRFPHELSGGQRQRVAIAASLVLDPELLVADEPVSMLDVSVRAGVLTLLDGLRRTGKMGVLMITHDLSTAAHFADRIAVMYLGKIVELGAARQVIRDPLHPYTRALLSVVPKRDPRDRSKPRILQGETPDPITIPRGCRFHPRCPVVASGRAAQLGEESRCRQEIPPLAELRPGHFVACHVAARTLGRPEHEGELADG
ncbi:MAG: ABC transporter ATP-binding protein [Actinomycetota bacterium]